MDIDIWTVIPTVSHTHNPNSESVAASRLKSTMMNISGILRGTPNQILVDTTSTAIIEIRATLGNPIVLKRTIRRGRAKHNHFKT
jgi:hypothetical protein